MRYQLDFTDTSDFTFLRKCDPSKNIYYSELYEGYNGDLLKKIYDPVGIYDWYVAADPDTTGLFIGNTTERYSILHDARKFQGISYDG